LADQLLVRRKGVRALVVASALMLRFGAASVSNTARHVSTQEARRITPGAMDGRERLVRISIVLIFNLTSYVPITFSEQFLRAHIIETTS
jgi:hypothetical protein